MLKESINIALEVGKEILKIYNFNHDITFKEDGSPLTLADKISNEIILNVLKTISNYPILSEESKEIPYEPRKNWKKFWLVDPLDGTKEFIKRNGEFTVNIALIDKSTPILGVVYAPAKNWLYFGSPEGAFKKDGEKLQQLKLKKSFNQNKIKAVVSRSHLDKETLNFLSFLEKQTGKQVERVSIGSSLKICYISEGKADIYPRLAPTMEWDTAAAHAILNFAGGRLVEFRGKNLLTAPELKYNKKILKNPPFVAFNPYAV